MKLRYKLLIVTVFSASMMGCATPDRHISNLRLGMNYEEVEDAMGKPFAVRASKMYEGEEWSDIWEYRPPIFSLAALTDKFDRLYWVFFENGRVVQWGEPGDFTYKTSLTPLDELPVLEYNAQKDSD